MIPEWPDSLPSAPLIEGFSVQGVDNIARAPVDLGPAKTRKRSTGEIKEVQCQVFLDDTQKEALEDFHAESLSQGAGRFKWKGLTDRVPGDYEEIKFQSKPRFQSRGLHWRVRLELIALPKAPPLELVRTNMTLNSLMDYSRAGEGTRWNADGVLEVVAADKPRYTFDPATGEYEGLLAERQRTNLYTESENPVNYSVASDATYDGPVSPSPPGLSLANITPDAGAGGTGANTGGVHFAANLTETGHYAFSCVIETRGITQFIVRRSTGEVSPTAIMRIDLASETFLVDDSVVGSARLTPLRRNNMYRLSGQFNADSAGPDRGYRVQPLDPDECDGVNGFWIGAPQIEKGDYPTTYMPTDGAEETRAADEAPFGNLDWLTQDGFAFVVEGTTPASADNFKNVFSLDDGTASESFELWHEGGSLRARVRESGDNKTITVPIAPYTKFRVAVSLENGSRIAMSVNGGAVESRADLSGLPTLTDGRVGDGITTPRHWDSVIKWTSAFRRPLSDAELRSESSL